MSEEEDEDLGIKENSIIEGNKAGYVVIKLLGEGGFGAVYLVNDTKDKSKRFAMKVEKKVENRLHSKLKMEVAILKSISTCRKQSHFTTIVDRGKKATYCFVVMQLVGKSLDDLKKARPDKVFSAPTGLSVALQCLEAVQDLHKCGFIHRDLKPANYACGLDDQKHLIYILDYGIARKITNEKNELKTPRATTKFKGTLRFASLACHSGKELGPNDDFESWFYLLLDLIVLQGLPWRRHTEKEEVAKVKLECRRERREQLWGGLKCREELSKLLDYIDKLQYHDHIDYDFAYKILEASATLCGGSVKDKYDWEKE